MLRRWLMVLAVLMTPAAALAAPKPDLWERWTAHDPAATTTVDHGVWDRFIATYRVPGSDDVWRIAYGRVTETDRRALDGYLAALQAVPVSMLNRAEQKAYWFNFYNALTVKVILDHYPVDGIRDIDISPGFFADGPWGAKLVTIEGEAVSLDDMEHRILRPIWRDPRIHYGVNCASIGCPDMPPNAFTAANTDGLLDAGARAYVNHPRGAQIVDGRLEVSSIYDWFDEDFGGNDAGVIAHLKQYAEGDLRTGLEQVTRISSDSYDWALNDAE